MAGQMKVEQLALVPFTFPTYANALGRAAVKVARQLGTPDSWPEDGLAEEVGLTATDEWTGAVRTLGAPVTSRAGCDEGDRDCDRDRSRRPRRSARASVGGGEGM
jgi:hypothetical protein